jgi:glycosyltransferase involved in cell wall biosynthesis
MFGVPDRLIAPTQWLLDQHTVRGFGARVPCAVIPNPLPDVGVHPLIEPVETQWMYVGNMSDQKGLPLIDQLAKARPTEAFTCIGDGPWRHTLGMLPNVRCVGQVPRELVLRELVQARAVLVPSQLIENQPTVILEAFALGVPVIASASGGIPETVGAGGQVVVLEQEAWMRALDEVNQAPETWRSRAVEQRTRFDRTSISVQWGKVLLQMLSEKKTHTPTPDRP